MVIVLMNWLYIFLVTFLMGFGTDQVISNKIVKQEKRSRSITENVMIGVVVTTVFAQYFSLVYKVGLVAQLILLTLCVMIAFKWKTEVKEYVSNLVHYLISWDGLIYVGVILLFAFFTSRGTIHTDTSLYHAQAIRWYEEYGVVKGLGNLQWHFAYNSSYFGFAALFSFGFLGGQPMHCTTGFIAIVLCIFAINRLLHFSEHTSHISDMCCVAILFYALVNMVGFVSPASDYVTMFIAIYLFTRWAQEIEEGSADTNALALLSVLAVYLATLKLSAGLCVLLVIYPASVLIAEKKWKDILVYLGLGILTVLPFLLRNYIISGWLLYPFSAIDFFNVDWKIPVNYLEIDAAQIKVWARCLYDPKLIDMPISEWLPIWWEAQERYGQMLILTNCLGMVLATLYGIHKIIDKKKIDWNSMLLFIVMIANAVAWLLLAPFIRYGLAFLLSIPFYAVGLWMQKKEKGLYQIVSGAIVILMFFILTPYWDHYFTDDMVFIKHNIREPYYIKQKDYDTSKMKEYNLSGITIYSPEEGAVTGYKYFPASSYSYMIESTELRGESLKDGFRPIEELRK